MAWSLLPLALVSHLAVANPRSVAAHCLPPRGRVDGRPAPTPPITVAGDPPTFVSAHGRRIVAVGDLHGDLAQTRSALRMAGILSADGYDWIGGDTVFVQVGDILDRGEDEIAILSLLRLLSMQAKSKGGAVFQVNGNHETINVEGDFRFVDPGAFDECICFLEYLKECKGNWDDAFSSWIKVSRKWREEYSSNLSNQWSPLNFMKRQKGVTARSSLFRPGGPLAYELARHPVVLKVDGWIFCHGGLHPHHAAYGLERLNKEVSRWMRGYSADNDDDPDIPFIATRGYDSVVWSRLYSVEDEARKAHDSQISSIAKETLDTVGAQGMIVGHTPQTNGANCKWDHQVWCIDVGMSRGVLNSRPEVLEIVDGTARVIRSISGSLDELRVAESL